MAEKVDAKAQGARTGTAAPPSEQRSRCGSHSAAASLDRRPPLFNTSLSVPNVPARFAAAGVPHMRPRKRGSGEVQANGLSGEQEGGKEEEARRSTRP